MPRKGAASTVVGSTGAFFDHWSDSLDLLHSSEPWNLDSTFAEKSSSLK